MTTTEQIKVIMDKIRSVSPEKRLEGLKMLRSGLSGMIMQIDLAIKREQEGGTHAEEGQETQIPSRED